jgi:signal transduction histidine kinase
MAALFAGHAAVALELSDARADQQRVALLEDRDRIARDLHDHVIQRLFAAGLTVQRVTADLGATEPGLAAGGTGKAAGDNARRLSQVVDGIDDTIRQIRTTIFRLQGPLAPSASSIRTRILAVADEATTTLGFAPDVRFTGPVDTSAPPDAADDVLAVVREALSNIARHARAAEASVDLRVDHDQLRVEIADNGVGMTDATRRSGLDNLRRRAEDRGGSITLTTPDTGGTRLTWAIPLT